MLAGRWNTQRLSCESTATTPTAPVTQLFGNSSDHSGSGSKRGISPRAALLCAPLGPASAAAAKPASTRDARRAGFVNVMVVGILVLPCAPRFFEIGKTVSMV